MLTYTPALYSTLIKVINMIFFSSIADTKYFEFLVVYYLDFLIIQIYQSLITAYSNVQSPNRLAVY